MNTSNYIRRPRVAPPTDLQRVAEVHQHYEAFINAGLITDNMAYIAYRVKDGTPLFVAGADGLAELVSELERKEGLPRTPCLIMDLSNHKNYTP
jgi:hypothetical protein